MTWRPFDPSLNAVRRANRCAWHDDCADADRWAKVLGNPAPFHEPIEVDNPPMLAPPDAEIENGRVVACKTLQPDRLRRARELAGLSLAQAAWRLVYPTARIRAMETGGEQPSAGLIDDMSALYGVAVGWLRGADPMSDQVADA